MSILNNASTELFFLSVQSFSCQAADFKSRSDGYAWLGFHVAYQVFKHLDSADSAYALRVQDEIQETALFVESVELALPYIPHVLRRADSPSLRLLQSKEKMGRVVVQP